MTGREISPATQALIDECRDALQLPDAEAELAAHYAGLEKPVDPLDPATATRARDESEAQP